MGRLESKMTDDRSHNHERRAGISKLGFATKTRELHSKSGVSWMFRCQPRDSFRLHVLVILDVNLSICAILLNYKDNDRIWSGVGSPNCHPAPPTNGHR